MPLSRADRSVAPMKGYLSEAGALPATGSNRCSRSHCLGTVISLGMILPPLWLHSARAETPVTDPAGQGGKARPNTDAAAPSREIAIAAALAAQSVARPNQLLAKTTPAKLHTPDWAILFPQSNLRNRRPAASVF